jgi:hypothetical protein
MTAENKGKDEEEDKREESGYNDDVDDEKWKKLPLHNTEHISIILYAIDLPLNATSLKTRSCFAVDQIVL